MNSLSRRNFLFGSAAAIAVTSGCKINPTKPHLGRPALKVGVLSDIHVMHDEPSTADDFAHALEYYRDQEVDAVLIAGDLADHGVVEDLQLVADTWFKVFPDNLGKNGAKVEKLFCYGNHDWEGWWYNNYPKKRPDMPESAKLCLDYPGHWERCFKEPYAPIYLKTVKGYHFIGAHFDNYVGVKGLKAFLAERRSLLAGDKPFFFFQHMHPKDTCSAPWVWGQDWGISPEALAEFPNAISFSGHSHTSLTDERVIWQGDFTSVGTASLSYAVLFGKRENARPMKPEKQGQLMRVYEDAIELERRDFVRDELLGVWTIPLPVADDKPYSFKERYQTKPAPFFAQDAKVEVKYEASSKRFRLKFPEAVGAATDARAWDYEIAVVEQVMDYEKVFDSRRLYSPNAYLAPTRETKPIELTWKLDNLPKGNAFRFRVTAFEAFGHASRPIYSQEFGQPEKDKAVVITELRNADRYTYLAPGLSRAFEFLRRKDLKTLANGKYELGEGVFAMVKDVDKLRRWTYEKFEVEAHRKYIDIHFPIGVEETMGNYTLNDEDLKAAYDEKSDCVFMKRVTWAYSVRPGEFAMYIPPRGGHVPELELDGAKAIRKIVVKVPVVF